MLILARHGQSEANREGLLLGRLDSPLTEVGRRQADAIAQAVCTRASSTARLPARIVTSPLSRARQTAEAIAARLGGAVAVEVDDRVVELDYGELDGASPRSLPASWWASWRADPGLAPPGGESLSEVHDRVVGALEEWSEVAASFDVVVVSHVSPIKSAVSWAVGAGPELAWRLGLDVASITRIRTTAGGDHDPSLVGFNDTSHLQGV